MTDRQAKCIMLRKLGMKQHEIAAMMGVSQTTISQTLRRAKEKNDKEAELRFLADAIKILEARTS